MESQGMTKALAITLKEPWMSMQNFIVIMDIHDLVRRIFLVWVMDQPNGRQALPFTTTMLFQDSLDRYCHATLRNIVNR